MKVRICANDLLAIQDIPSTGNLRSSTDDAVREEAAQTSKYQSILSDKNATAKLNTRNRVTLPASRV